MPPNQAPPTPTRETYDELQIAFDFFNKRLFEGKLPPCLITLQRERRTKGYYSYQRFVRRSGEIVDEIAMNPAYFAVFSVGKVLSTLAHEMTHQWQRHFGAAGRRGYHNKEWGGIMEGIGLMPSNTGMPGGQKTGEKMSHYVIPGGKFERVCAELEDLCDLVSWLDRLPAYVHVPSDVTEPVGGAPGTELSEDDKALIRREAEQRLQNMRRAQELGVQMRDRPVNNTHRDKYRCPVCGVQVWGKPGLRIACLNCGGQQEMQLVRFGQNEGDEEGK